MKSTTKAGLLAAILLLGISCSKESLRNPQSASNQTKDNSASQTAGHYIGERFGGGVVFYIDGTGLHGLISDTVDLPTATWFNPLNGLYVVTGATATKIGAGKANTHKIVQSQGDSGVYAARVCWKSKRSSYKDWFAFKRSTERFIPAKKSCWEF